MSASRSPVGSALSRSRGYGFVRSAATMGELAVRTVRVAVRPPYNWAGEAIEHAGVVCRRCMFPLIVSGVVYVFVYAVMMFGEFMVSLGVSDRYSAAATTGILREVITWLTMMIFAGVAGSALTADIGARKVREELDALDVLGVNTVRYLVMPRVVGMVLAGVALPLICLLTSTFMLSLSVVPSRFGYSYGVVWDGLAHSVTTIDFAAAMIKHLVMAFVIAIIACERGLTCSRGAEGVGRAVNQSVVLSYVAVWLMNSFYNTAYLSFFPDAVGFRG